MTDSHNSAFIANARVELRANDTTYTGQTDQNGHFQQAVLFDNYEIWVGHWGHQTQQIPLTVSAATTVPVQLDSGYKDEFALDLGWQATADLPNGDWVMQQPYVIPSFVFPFITFDANDLGSKCLTTGPYPIGLAPMVWMDSGSTTISSPLMDLSDAGDPYINFQYHYATFSFLP